jgi:hypothetical protein
MLAMQSRSEHGWARYGNALESRLVRSKIDQGRDQELRELPGLRLAFWVFG